MLIVSGPSVVGIRVSVVLIIFGSESEGKIWGSQGTLLLNYHYDTRKAEGEFAVVFFYDFPSSSSTYCNIFGFRLKLKRRPRKRQPQPPRKVLKLNTEQLPSSFNVHCARCVNHVNCLNSV